MEEKATQRGELAYTTWSVEEDGTGRQSYRHREAGIYVKDFREESVRYYCCLVKIILHSSFFILNYFVPLHANLGKEAPKIPFRGKEPLPIAFGEVKSEASPLPPLPWERGKGGRGK